MFREMALSKLNKSIIKESKDKSEYSSSFKKKTGGSFKYIKFPSSEAEKYMKKDTHWDKQSIDHFKQSKVGELVIDKEKDIIAGYIFVNKSKGILSPLRIYDEYKGYGLSNTLVKDAIDKFGAKELGVYTDNQVAIKLYSKHGFEDTKKRKKYKDGDEVMFMKLNESIIKESENDRSNILNLVNKSLEKENIKTHISSEDKKYFFTGRENDICLGSFKKENYNKAYSIAKEVLKDKPYTVRKDNYFTIYIYAKQKISESYLEESDNTYIDGFKTKKNDKKIKYIDISNPEAKKYLMKDSYSKKIIDLIKNYDGEIIIDEEKDIPIGRIFVYNKNDKKNYGFIHSFYIDKNYRGYGFANRLIKDAITKYNGFDLIVKKNNKIAIELYKKNGFVIDDSRHPEKQYYYMILKSHKKSLSESYIENETFYINEAKRSDLPDSSFGIPEDRKFPLDTEDHVKSAIKLFGHADEDKKKSLAKRIEKAAKKYKIDIPKTTQCYKYLHESYIEESTSMDRKYRCPYCDNLYKRKDLPRHIENKHEDLIPKDMTPLQITFNTVNKKTHGTCTECGGESPWNEEKGRYDRICTKKSCHNSYVKSMKSRMIRKYGKEHILNDAEVQKRMLENRKISGTYIWSDGTKFSYCGSYEKALLAFLDRVLLCKSEDIITPGPVIEYTYKGQTHKWIMDVYYIPYNLCIDVKDGGTNPNNRPMEEYREKQEAKEQSLAKLGKFNYIRLTDNDFTQLFDTFLELKMNLMDNDDKKVININEQCSTTINALPPINQEKGQYIIQYMMNNTFTKGYGYCTDNELTDDIHIIDSFGKSKIIHRDEFLGMIDEYTIFKYNGNHVEESYDYNTYPIDYYYTKLTGRRLLDDKQIFIDSDFTIESKLEDKLDALREVYISSLNNNTILENDIGFDKDGIYRYNPETGLRTKSYDSLEKINKDEIKIIGL